MCIFCKIVAGELPSTKVYEDEKTLAFMDINPVNPGHTLLIPKKHVETIYELDEETGKAVMSTLIKLVRAVKKATNCQGVTIHQANEKAANQVVPHLHIHIIPRWEKDYALGGWKAKPGDPEEIKKQADKIRNCLGS
ncbi:MAG: HIT family protein [Methanobacteriota archaeon]|nr:MAG: HIT family protein [Euryarchaeota archaeon]